MANTVQRRQAAPAREVPRLLSEVSTRWLGEALGAPVIAFDLHQIATGVGLMGQLARVRPLYDVDTAGPASLIVKLPTAHDVNLEIGRTFRFFEREVRFYQLVGSRAGVRVPHCFHATVDESGTRAALLLEDLAHGRAADQLQGLGLADARAAVTQLAHLHATWWDDPRLDDLPWMPMADDATIVAGAVDLVERSWDAFLGRYGSTLPAEALRLGERLPDRIPDLLSAGTGGPLTINHGDYRADNLFFDLQDAPCAVVDWQLATRARMGTFDLVYFLGASLSSDVRRRHDRALYETYRQALAGFGVEDADDMVADDLARAAAVCLVYAVGAGAELDPGDQRGRRLVDRIVTAYFELAVELDAASALV